VTSSLSVAHATAAADVLTFNDAGKLVTLEALGDTTQLDRVFAE
jgi:hypothetical protein